jgi:FMN phosphatase YigB (HAD superfamily)
MKQKVSTIITDLDNTLYNWVEMWYQSFSLLLKQLVARSGISQEVLIAEIREAFQEARTSEYRYFLQELPSLKSQQPLGDVEEQYHSILHDYQKAREEYLCLYPGVLPTLKALKERKCLVVAFTDSMASYSISRVKTLHLDGFLDYLYTIKDYKLPKDYIDKKPGNQFEGNTSLQKTIHRYLPEGEYKPNPKVLLDIIRDVGAQIDQTIYVGDNLMKDIVMAQSASVTDVFAKYGAVQNTEAYALLRQVSHWPDKTVEEERSILEKNEIRASYVLEDSFSELLNLFDFISASRLQKI